MANSLRLIFMGTPEFALPTLDALAKAHDVVAVYTQPPRPAGRGQKESLSPVHQFALSHHLPVYTPTTLKDAEVQNAFREHKADAAIVVAYGLLLPPPILAANPMGCINVHPSLLPRWRGAAPVERAIMAGDKKTGVVIMQMDAGLDTGDMLLTRHFPIPDGMNAGTLRTTLAEMAAPMVIQTLDGLRSGMIKPVKQPEAGSVYAPKITKEECRIDWNQPVNIVRQKILALSPGPGAFFICKGETIKALDAKVSSKSSGNHKPGTAIDNHLSIACSIGTLEILQVQRPGKKPMPAAEMLKGHRIPEGELLS